ncbi:uncharacterized protein LOC129731156 [Wyeomyia smithii]|uniref:uncharacterized protein LOC129731156 n=1 Tax=Wyeomyia smithii TaxID=174621 RepID=UPI002467C0E9|nr:uncharacterized protein LOC129731156 [Wyeomyia smithii]XP_055546923.1 uncharacterized protein LOC129731156 [Wyeomyia smithii]
MPHHKSQLAVLIKGRGHAGFSEYEVLKIFCDVCESLAQLHCCQAPIIYRDLKVENIVQNDMGRFILADSDTATTRFLNPAAHGKKLVEDEVQKHTTAAYRAPEMLDLNSGHSITTKVDIWALGCLLFRLCFGAMPFGESSKAILHCQYNIPEKNKYSPELCQLIRLLLEPDPENRPSIYQVCELAFRIAGKDNPLKVDRSKAQPAKSSNSEQAAERKTQYTTITATTSGTSVVPRSRPKAQQTNTGSGFQLGPPPLNPSPKNVSPTLGSEVICPEKNVFVANFSDNFPLTKLNEKSPATKEQLQLEISGGDKHRSSTGSGYRFFQSDSNNLFVPALEASTVKDISNAVSPASLLSPFEQEPPSSSSSSARLRPTTLFPTGATPGASQRHQQALSNSNSEKSLVSPISSSTWNPFGDPSSFSPSSTLTEDQLFGAEFDKLRLDGSNQTSIVTSPEEIKSEQGVAAVPTGWLLHPQHQRFSLPIISQTGFAGTLTIPTHDVVPEEDPFGSAPFTLPKRLKDKTGRSSRLTSKLGGVISNAAVGSGNLWHRHSTGGSGPVGNNSVLGKESLIPATSAVGGGAGRSEENGDGTMENCMDLSGSAAVDKSSLLGIKLDDLISGGEKGSPSFIKLPIDDRNKYEKLNSNDITSDDSDSEFYPDTGVGIGGGAKKQSFKQFVESNIPEKLQAVYHKVDKGQIKNVQLVKKLRGKVVLRDDPKKSKGKERAVKTSVGEKQKDGESDDSIGSASDLRANDDFVEEHNDVGKVANSKSTRQFNRTACDDGSVDDCISESIKTCGSSAYHAECESVTTNEDNTSRIVMRIKIKKREHDSKHSVIDEDNSGEEDMVQGDKPLLLDDELDYESAPENKSSGDEPLMDPFTPESLTDVTEKQHFDDDDIELDPFALAPFRKPTVPKRSSIKYMPQVHPIPENYPPAPVLVAPSPEVASATDFFTSTPIKPAQKRSQPEVDMFATSPAPSTHTVIVPESGNQRGETSNSRIDLFGLEPFPPLIISQPVAISKPVCIPTVTVEPGSVTLTHIIPSARSSMPIAQQEAPLPATAATQQHQQSSQMTARHSYINYNQITQSATSFVAPSENYVNFDPNDVDDDDGRKLKSDDYDDSSDSVIIMSSSKTSGGGSSSFLGKKEKVKYNCLRDTASATTCGTAKHDPSHTTMGPAASSNSGNSVLVIPVKLSQKVKVNVVGGYRKVSNKSSKKDKSSSGNNGVDIYDSPPIGKPQSSKASKKMGFSNMSFEDFPSDELGEDESLSTGGATSRQAGSGNVGSKLMKIAPFEVIRNEKMLLEAEKKFGSLKRRSNPFS